MNGVLVFIGIAIVLGGPFNFSDDAPLVNTTDTIESLRKERDELRRELAKQQNFQAIQISGLSNLQAQTKAVQWVITTSPACQPCHVLVRNLQTQLVPVGWSVGEDENAQFRITSITHEEWQRRGITLPQAQLMLNGYVIKTGVSAPISMAMSYTELVTKQSRIPNTNEQVAGLSIGTITGAAQVTQILNALTPFLDGGTLEVNYIPRAGVVKDFLTIKQGSAGIKIPSKTSIKLSIANGRMDIVPQGVKPIVIVGPLERNIDAIEMSANKLSVRLPWMLDPEWNIK